MPARSCNRTLRLSLIDLAMYLEKLWIFSGVKSKKENIEAVKAYRIKNNLES